MRFAGLLSAKNIDPLAFRCSPSKQTVSLLGNVQFRQKTATSQVQTKVKLLLFHIDPKLMVVT